jgi:signal transduction histidine kinase
MIIRLPLSGRRQARIRSVRWHVAMVALACLLPSLIFSGLMLLRYAGQEREIEHGQIFGTARAIMSSVDLELRSAVAALAALATSTSLTDGDLRPFYEQCKEVAAQNHGGWIVLLDDAGRALFHTRRPFGEALGPLNALEGAIAAVSTGQPQFSDLFRGAVAQQYQVAIFQPVKRNGVVTHVLGLGVPAEALSGIFAEQRIAKEWTIALMDRTGVILGRNRDLDKVIGRLATADLRARMAEADEGQFLATTQEGTPVYTGFTRSSFSRWSVAVGIPVAVIEAPLWHSLQTIAAGGLALVAGGLALALLAGRRIGAGMRALGAAALALGKGEQLPRATSGVREVNEVLAAQATALELLRERERQRDAAETHRRELERQLHHSQKLEALGTLAGGIAHDLNNTLVPIVSLSQVALKHVAGPGRERERLELIRQAGARARDLVQQILMFSRKGAGQRREFAPDVVLHEALALLRPIIPATIGIKPAIAEGLALRGDPTQLHQVIVNLLTNAAQAIGEKPGTITVELERAPDNEARLTVGDDGCGMDETTRRRLFEPFFTTKAVGVGSGLGLAVVHGIVSQHDGTIAVESAPGAGTRFVITFPLATAEEVVGEVVLVAE